jgi:hypothetical protein
MSKVKCKCGSTEFLAVEEITHLVEIDEEKEEIYFIPEKNNLTIICKICKTEDPKGLKDFHFIYE